MSTALPRRTPRSSALARTTGLLVALVVGLSACGESSTDDDPTVSQPSAGAITSAPVQGPQAPASGSCPDAPELSPAPASSTVDLTKKPVVPKGAPKVDALQVADIVVGTGAVVCTGQPLSMKYVGVLAADGTQFDASWDRGADEVFDFVLGGGEVIQGWDQGIVGMKVGGRRQLTIPSALGYGPAGRAPIPPDATLVFVVDLVKVG